MGQNTQSNQKHTWTKLAAIAPLPPLCAFLPLTMKESSLLPFPLSRIYINLPKESLKSAGGKSPHFLSFLCNACLPFSARSRYRIPLLFVPLIRKS